MSSETTSQESNTPAAALPPPAAAPTPDKRRTGWLTPVLLLLILAALGAGGWLALQQHQQNLAELAVVRDRLATLQTQEQQHQQQALQLQQQLQELQQAQQTQQQQIAHNTDRLGKLPGAERQDWLLAEAEYLLRLANQRLQLERDWHGALSLLQAADKVLVETRNPGLSDIRATLAQEMLALRAAPALDSTGAVLRLQALQQKLPQLPWLPDRLLPDGGHDVLATVAAEAPADLRWYEQLLQKVSSALTGLVRIRERAAPVAAPLTPDQQYYLQQNMHLMLEQAQAALLREQAELYQHSLQRVQIWLQNYLLIEDERTRAVQQALQELLAWPVAPARPDISRSLLQLQQWTEQQRRGMAAPGEAA